MTTTTLGKDPARGAANNIWRMAIITGRRRIAKVVILVMATRYSIAVINGRTSAMTMRMKCGRTHRCLCATFRASDSFEASVLEVEGRIGLEYADQRPESESSIYLYSYFRRSFQLRLLAKQEDVSPADWE
jgi:hypothetical protein